VKAAIQSIDRFSTGQIAKMTNVAPRTVSKWIDSGRLVGYRIPGGKDRRVMRADLEAFSRTHGIPLAGLEPTKPKNNVLCVGVRRSAKLLEILNDLSCKYTFTFSLVTAGMIMAVEKPTVVIVDTAIGRIDSVVVGDSVRGCEMCRDAKLVAIVHSEDHGIGKPFQFFLHENFGHSEIREILSRKETS
jgi:excisionase family DNA binding protein